MFRAFVNYAAELDILKDTARVFQSTGKTKGKQKACFEGYAPKRVTKNKAFPTTINIFTPAVYWENCFELVNSCNLRAPPLRTIKLRHQCLSPILSQLRPSPTGGAVRNSDQLRLMATVYACGGVQLSIF